jgi:hypothetical protein
MAYVAWGPGPTWSAERGVPAVGVGGDVDGGAVLDETGGAGAVDVVARDGGCVSP